MKIINGQELAASIRAELNKQIKKLDDCLGLAVVVAGNNEASKIYVRNKINACKEVGIESFLFELPENVSQQELLNVIDKLNMRKDVQGILVQLPLPSHINADEVIQRILPAKDVDGFCIASAGALFLGIDSLYPCTPLACVELIKSTGEKIAGKHAVIVGRSNIVGKPLSQLLLQENATVTVCHSKTVDLPAITKTADILVAAIGKPRFITQDMVKPNAIVIDVGINRLNGKLCGDVDFENVQKKCAFITPVPKGVGPMTITMLLKNTLKAYKLQQKLPYKEI